MTDMREERKEGWKAMMEGMFQSSNGVIGNFLTKHVSEEWRRCSERKNVQSEREWNRRTTQKNREKWKGKSPFAWCNFSSSPYHLLPSYLLLLSCSPLHPHRHQSSLLNRWSFPLFSTLKFFPSKSLTHFDYFHLLCICQKRTSENVWKEISYDSMKGEMTRGKESEKKTTGWNVCSVGLVSSLLLFSCRHFDIYFREECWREYCEGGRWRATK